ncbi:MAG: DUF998 domain-containing protein [Promethearchaeota archaeon]|nr:MAG: DUF998 domain-containing protein [Candidatus Lokiarchaeota archaeon]
MISVKNKLESMFGLVGIIISSTLLFMAVLLTPGYNPLEDTVSSLGLGPAKSLFSIAFVIGGSMGIPFYIYLERELSNLNETVRRLATAMSIITCVCIALVGIIPDETYIEIFRIFHSTVAFFSFISSAAYIGLFSILMYLSSNKSQFSRISFRKYHAILGFVIVGVLIILLITLLPIVEWIMTVLILTWIFISSIFVFVYQFIYIPVPTLRKLPNKKLLHLFEEILNILNELNLDQESITKAVKRDIKIIESRIEKEHLSNSKEIKNHT